MRVLVTGAAGFIGSHLCERLIAEGHDVTGIDAFTDYYARPIKEENLAALRREPRFSFVEADLRTDPLERRVDGHDAVINLAAMAGLMRSWADLEAYLGCNVLGLQRLLEACRAAGVRRFVQASSSSVYGTDAVGDEDQPTRPASPYGITKLAADQLVLAYVAAYGLPAVILRYFSIYGPRQRPDMAYHLFIEAMLDRRQVTVYGDGLQSRSNTYVGDCIRATIDAMTGGRTGEVYNIGGGEEITLLRAIELIAEACDVTPEIVHAPPRPGDQRRTWADTRKAAEAFGYRPSTSAAEGMAQQVRWHVSRRAG